MTFPARPNLPNMAMPEVEVTWYDGGFRGMIPENLPEGKRWEGEGCALYGTKDTLILGSHGSNPYLLSGRTPQSPEVLRVVPGNNHYLDWVAACKNPDFRDKIALHFVESGPFNEMVLMAGLGVRLQNLNKILLWDGLKMEFTNISDTETVQPYAQSRSMADTLAVTTAAAQRAGGAAAAAPAARPAGQSGVNARQYVASLVKREYLNGFKLPDMPA